MTTPISLPCQLLAASGCAYSISGTSYNPPANDPFGPAIGWTSSGNLPQVITGGFDNEDAALVGTISVDGTTAIVVAFEGTIPPAHTLEAALAWLQDFIATPTAEEDIPGLIHPGIYTSVNNVYVGVTNAIAALVDQFPNADLYITGHSKGGGMATLFTGKYFLDQRFPKVPNAVYTFASPMVGNAEFVALFTSQPLQIPIYRYENTLDIVPFLAPSTSFIETLMQNMHLKPLTYVLDGIIVLFEEGADAGNWGYVPAGNLSYIDGTSITNPNTNPCAPQIAATLAKNIPGLDEVLNAHSHLCGYGYMTGTCNSMGVCPI